MDKIDEYLDKRRGDRERLFVTFAPVFVKLYAEKREVFIKIATVAATIGAFSFLLFDSTVLKSPPLLICGDLALLLVIVASLILYTRDLRKFFYDFHNTYHSVFENQTREIQAAQKFQRGELDKGAYDRFLKTEIDKILEYDRPLGPKFPFEWLMVGILSLALLLLALSFLVECKNI